MLLLGFSDYRTPAQRLAAALQLNYHEVELHRFPDGESKVTLPLAAGAMTGQHVVLCRSLDQPNSKLIELMLAVATLR
ncbi:MAG: ribose-phosphate pyrophosphokinase-like domain-containing protein, partial [Candidatus Competibacteraceae bacterium]|nr:ribose-phosphate pyrophosphokinase-like domain-containing protein [Candidatus Competibacteraceae bacterium]